MTVQLEKKVELTSEQIDTEKRDFMKKFGQYAVVGAGMAVLMSPTDSSAGNYISNMHQNANANGNYNANSNGNNPGGNSGKGPLK